MAGMVQVPFGHTTVRRLAPAPGPQHYKTYGMRRPLATHWRRATCEEAGCDAYRYGWASTFDLGTDLGQRQYAYCKADRTRSFHEQRDSLTLVKLVYKPGNQCFPRPGDHALEHLPGTGNHRVPLERPAVFVVAEGDWRGNPRGVPVRVHRRAEDWCEDFAEHQDNLASAIQEG